MKSKKSKALFFIIGPAPTADERKLVDSLISATLQIAYRNAEYVGPKDAVEPCDFVGGAVPKAYAHLPKLELPAPAFAHGGPIPAGQIGLVSEVPVIAAPIPALAPAPVEASAPAITGDGSGEALPPVATEEPELEPIAPVALEVDENSTKADIVAALTARGLNFKQSQNKAELLEILRG